MPIMKYLQPDLYSVSLGFYPRNTKAVTGPAVL